jgi:hypothetical protein
MKSGLGNRNIVIPAKAGVQGLALRSCRHWISRFRGNDDKSGKFVVSF